MHSRWQLKPRRRERWRERSSVSATSPTSGRPRKRRWNAIRKRRTRSAPSQTFGSPRRFSCCSVRSIPISDASTPRRGTTRRRAGSGWNWPTGGSRRLPRYRSPSCMRGAPSITKRCRRSNRPSSCCVRWVTPSGKAAAWRESPKSSSRRETARRRRTTGSAPFRYSSGPGCRTPRST